MHRTQTRLRIGFGLVAMVAVLALVAFMTMVSSSGGATSVSATGPTPTLEPNPGTDGFLSGIQDLEVTLGTVIYHCISRTDHDATSNRVKTSTQCYVDLAGTGDPASLLSGVNVPGEGPTAGAGPAPPPPYTIQQPNIGAGEYFPGGNVDCGNVGSGTCLVVITCFPDLGAGSLGPNLITKLIVPDPTGDADAGTVDLLTGRSNKQCASLDTTGFPNFPLPIGLFAPAGTAPTSWRTAAIAGVGSATDFDGDGCSDLAELDSKLRPKGCGDDPYNPLDSHTADGMDYSGPYNILVRVVRADTTGTSSLDPAGGFYFGCLADIQQNGNGKSTSGDLATAGIVARAFCYTDGDSVVNALGYPGVKGDGYPGGGPAWGAIPALGPPETDCTRFPIINQAELDNDGDTVANDGCPPEALGDTDSKQTILPGYVDNADNTLKLRGCFQDEDASSSLLNVYVEVEVDRNTGVGGGPNPGGVTIWPFQTEANCTAPHAFGAYATDPDGGGTPLAAFTNVEISIVPQNAVNTVDGRGRDTDQDGCPDAKELGDDPEFGGLRDPYNPYDWYDVPSAGGAPPDGAITLFGDILGVISHFSIDGSPPYDAAWDRGDPIAGGAGNWSRKGPDGVITLFGDILGVISQFSNTGCN